MPTILGLSGISPGELVLEGRDLAAALTAGTALDSQHPVFFQRRFYEEEWVPNFAVEGVVFGRPLRVRGSKYGVLQGRWKYVVAPAEKTRELYDLSSDPKEQANLVSRHRERASELSGQLEAWLERQDSLALAPGREADEEDLERLRALGYVR
jgi:arylsulfatase A-like enzyme